MSYQLRFTDDGERAMNNLDKDERQQVAQKFDQITSSPFRDPADWDFTRMEGCAEGRFRITNGLRAFADIDNQNEVIWIHQIRRRENLYT